jgi:uncharacterized protein with PhoU and TrkA domain
VSEEEIRYKPISVRELLTEMQTVIGLIVDLAYSAVLFHDHDLAEEVMELEERVDTLKVLLLMNTAIAIRDADDAEAMVGIMQMASVADRISDAAGDIARLVLLEIGIDPYLVEAFTKVKERLVRTRILPGSILVKKTLGELSLESNIGVKVIVLRRRKELLINPDAETRLMEGDILVARGSDVGASELDGLAKGELKAIPRPTVEVDYGEWLE